MSSNRLLALLGRQDLIENANAKFIHHWSPNIDLIGIKRFHVAIVQSGIGISFEIACPTQERNKYISFVFVLRNFRERTIEKVIECLDCSIQLLW